MYDEEMDELTREYILNEMVRPLAGGYIIGGGVSSDGFPMLRIRFREGREVWATISEDDEMNGGGRIMIEEINV